MLKKNSLSIFSLLIFQFFLTSSLYADNKIYLNNCQNISKDLKQLIFNFEIDLEDNSITRFWNEYKDPWDKIIPKGSKKYSIMKKHKESFFTEESEDRYLRNNQPIKGGLELNTKLKLVINHLYEYDKKLDKWIYNEKALKTNTYKCS